MRLDTNSFRSDYVKNGAFLFIGRVLPMAALFLITIVYSRRLSYGDYGIFQSVWMFTNILTVVVGFGVNSIILSTPDSELSKYCRLLKTRISLFFTGFALLSFCVFVALNRTYALPILIVIILFTLLQVATAINESYLIKRGYERKLLITNIFYSLFFLSWHFYIIYSDYNLFKLITGVFLLSVIKYLLLLKPKQKDQEAGILLHTSVRAFLEHWMFTGLNDVVGVVSKWIDKLFLLYFLTAADFAVFFNGSFEIPLFGLLITVAGSLLMSKASQHPGNKRTAVVIFRDNFVVLSAIVFPIFFFLLFNTPSLFLLAFGKKYDASIPIFFISLFILPIRINNYGALLQALGKGKIVFMGSVIDILVVLLIILFIYPIYGTKGVAAAVVIGTYFQIGYYLFHSLKATGVSVNEMLPIWALVKRLIILLIIYSWCYFFIPKSFVWLKLGTSTVLTILIIIAGLYKFKTTNDLISDGSTQ